MQLSLPTDHVRVGPGIERGCTCFLAGWRIFGRKDMDGYTRGSSTHRLAWLPPEFHAGIAADRCPRLGISRPGLVICPRPYIFYPMKAPTASSATRSNSLRIPNSLHPMPPTRTPSPDWHYFPKTSLCPQPACLPLSPLLRSSSAPGPALPCAHLTRSPRSLRDTHGLW